MAPSTQALEQLLRDATKAKMAVQTLVARGEAREILADVMKDVTTAEDMAAEVQEKAKVLLQAPATSVALEDATKIGEEVSAGAEAARTSLTKVKGDVMNKMKELAPNATETRKAFGELNVKLSTLEARVRQTAAAVAAALDMKKLEAQMTEIMQKVDDCKAAGAPVKEELVTEIDEAIAAVK